LEKEKKKEKDYKESPVFIKKFVPHFPRWMSKRKLGKLGSKLIKKFSTSEMKFFCLFFYPFILRTLFLTLFFGFFFTQTKQNKTGLNNNFN